MSVRSLRKKRAIFLMEKVMHNFVPRHISEEQAEKGYNNEGRGELLGYIAVPSQHEESCRYRISTGGDPDKQPHESCSCRIGLWQDNSSQRVVNEMRAIAKRAKPKPSPKAKSKPKEKAKPKTRKKSKTVKVKKRR